MGKLIRRNGSRIWTAVFTDAQGRTRWQSTKSTERMIGEEILAHIERREARVRANVITPEEAGRAESERVHVSEHVEAYIAHCRHAGQAPRAIAAKRATLEGLIESRKLSRLSQITDGPIVAYLQAIATEDLSPRTVNHRRAMIGAFLSWARKTKRTNQNPMAAVPIQDERDGRRRIRRAMTTDEVAALLAVARERGRWLWYATALLAGLRKGDLRRLTWSDVDLREGTLTIRNGKAKRVDVLPMHPDLAAEFERVRPLAIGAATSRVFPTVVTDATRLRDFERAGLARRVPVLDKAGQPVMIGKDSRRRPKTRLVAEDRDGRVLDLHAMRATLGTMLARQGVAPQVAMQLLRHSDYRTTLRHYTALTLHDSAAAIGRIELPAAVATATGTEGGCSESATRRGAIEGTAAQAGARATPASNARSDARKAGKRGKLRASAHAGASTDNMERRGLEPRTSNLQSCRPIGGNPDSAAGCAADPGWVLRKCSIRVVAIVVRKISIDHPENVVAADRGVRS